MILIVEAQGIALHDGGVHVLQVEGPHLLRVRPEEQVGQLRPDLGGEVFGSVAGLLATLPPAGQKAHLAFVAQFEPEYGIDGAPVDRQRNQSLAVGQGAVTRCL